MGPSEYIPPEDGDRIQFPKRRVCVCVGDVQNCVSYTIIGAVFSNFCVNWTVPKIIVYEFELMDYRQ
jgi:hypothetical protein